MYKHTVYKNQFMVAAIALMCIFVFIPLQKTQAIELGKCSCTTTGTKGGKAVKDPVKELTNNDCQNLQKPSSKFFEKKCTWVANPPTSNGNCHCIIGEQPPKQGACFENVDYTTCKSKEDTDTKACYLAVGQTGKCTSTTNKEFTQKQGDCACTVPGKEITPTPNHSPTQCAGLQANFKKENPTVKDKIKCAWAPKAAGTSGKPLDKIPPAPIATPKLHIPIPGLQFSKVTADEDDKGVDIPWLAEYATAAYNYLIGVGIIFAIIIMMIGGIQWMTAGGSGRVEQAKEKINRATFGLALLLGSYFILTIINPEILSLQVLDIIVVDREEAEMQAEFNSRGSSAGVVGGTAESSGSNKPSVVGGAKMNSGPRNKVQNDRPPKAVLQNLKDTSYCKVKNPSKVKDKPPGVKMNYDYYGSLDCNNSKNFRKKKNIVLIILHNGRSTATHANSQKNWSKSFGKEVYYPVYKQIVDWRSARYGSGFPASSHFTVGRDGTVYQTADVLLETYHAKKFNSQSIGIDLIFKKEGGKWVTRTNKKTGKKVKKLINYDVTWTDAQYKAVGRLVKYLGTTYGIPINDETVRGHGECQDSRTDAQHWDFEKMGKSAGATFNNKLHARTQNPRLTSNFSQKFSASCKKVP